MLRRVTVACTLVLAVATGASAQSGFSATSTVQSPPGAQTSSSAAPEETRPATTTFFGDTGLWFVPTGEVLDHGKWSVSGYRRGTNYIQGFSNVGDIAGTFAVGIKNRAELFGSFLVDTRIDRDLVPLFINNPDVGGIVDRNPRVHQRWTGDNVGDFYVGGKINLWSEFRQNPAALAFRGMVKLPTGDKDVGVSTGQADFSVDFIGSKELRRKVELSGYAGYEFRGKPDGFDIPGGASRWGVGAGFPSRSAVTRRARTGRLGAHQRHGDHHLRPGGGRGRHDLAGDLGDPEPDAGERRADLAASVGVLHRRGPGLEFPDEGSAGFPQ